MDRIGSIALGRGVETYIRNAQLHVTRRDRPRRNREGGERELAGRRCLRVGVIAKYFYDNYNSTFSWKKDATNYNDVMVIELRGRPTRDWYRWDAIGMMNSYNPQTVRQSALGYRTVGYGCTNENGTNAGYRKQFVFPGTADMGVGGNPFIDKTYAYNPPLWQNIIVAASHKDHWIQFSDGAKPTPRIWGEYLKSSPMSICSVTRAGRSSRTGRSSR